MAKLKLTVACDKYDYLQPLRDGQVKAEGLDLNLITVESGIRHERMYHYGEYDACEFSMSSYLVARGQDVDWLQAIPFFPRRMWGHKFCFIRAGSEVKKPSDLKGGRIGLRSYENTLALVTKGMLMNSYDLAVSDVTWVIVNKEHVGFKLPPSIKVEFVDGKRRLEDLLVEGKVDAEVEPDLPQAWIRGQGTVQRLFADFEKEERDYYRRTKILPIMHTLALRQETYEKYPWVAQSLFKAFSEAKRLCQESMYEFSALKYMLAWSIAEMEEEREIFGEDLWPYGLEANRHVLETLVQYAHEQGLIKKKVDLKSLFAPSTLEDFKI